MTAPTIAMIGCSGAVGAAFVTGFAARGAGVRVLARDPAAVAARHGDVEVIEGSMLVPDDVATVVAGADVAFVVTPMGERDDPTSEIAAGRLVAEGLESGEAAHVVYNSVLGADRRRGVGVLDAKFAIEPILAATSRPLSILRSGTFMEDIFDPRLPQLRKGRLVFPLSRDRRFTYTCQGDVAPFVLDELVAKGQVVGGPINFVSPGTYSLLEVEDELTAAAGRTVRTVPKFPAYHLLQAAQPLLRRRGGRFSSIVPLLRWFEANGYTDEGPTVGDRFPDFATTSLAAHLSQLFAAPVSRSSGAR